MRAPVPVPKEAVDPLTSESSFPGGAGAANAATGAGADGGVGVGESSNVSRTVRNDAIDPLSLSSSSSSLLSLPLIAGAGAGGAGAASTTIRGGAEGITIGFGGGAGGGDWARSALRSGIFGGVPMGAVDDIGVRGGGGRDVGRERDDEAGDCVANTLAGASTDSNEIPCPLSPRRLYFVTDGGARTLTNPPTGPAPLPGSLGRPEVARSHAARLFCVTLSTIARREFPPRPASACEGGGSALTCKVEVLVP